MNGPGYFPAAMRYFPIAMALILALLFRAVPAQADERPRGLGFLAYLSIERGMPDGEVFAIAGRPDLVADQGFAPEMTPVLFDRTYPPAPCGPRCLVRTFTYLPTPQEPYTTTVTFVGGRVNEIERNRKF